MSTEIYYFSGTGNSLHVARELQKRIPETKLIPILSLLDKDIIITKGETIGFVFPIYLSSTPVPVRRFLKIIDLKPTQYIFAVTTNCGYPGKVNIYLEKLLKKRGKNIHSYFTLKMMGNSPKGVMPSFMITQDWASRIAKETISALEHEVQNELDTIYKVIMNKEKNTGKDNPNPPNFFMKYVERLLYLPIEWASEYTHPKINFYADSTCTGCKICEKVCLSKKVKMKNGKPLWKKDINCYYCYACFNFCPEQSILVKNYTHKDGRYCHPDVTAKDIAEQKGLKIGYLASQFHKI